MSNKSFLILSVFLLTFISGVRAENKDYKILSSDNSQITIEYKPEFTLFEKSKTGYDYSVRGTIMPEDTKFPALFVKSFSIGVPAFDNSVEIVRADFEKFSGKLKAGFSKIPGRNTTFDKWVIKANEGIARGLRVQNYFVYPLLYSENGSEILKLKKIIFRINYGKGNDIFEKNAENNFAVKSVLNSEAASNWILTRNRNKSARNSVLASGVWHMANITEEGIYKINYDKLLALGFDPENDDPRTIKIFNNGGKAQAVNDDDPRFDDLIENPILFFGDQDGKLDEQDYLLFYGHGSSFFYFDSVRKTVLYYHHPYSTHNYYWITWGGDTGKRAAKVPFTEIGNATARTTTEAYFSREVDKYNPMKSGLLFFDEEVNQSRNSLSYSFDLPSEFTEPPVEFVYDFAVYSSQGFWGQLRVNGNIILSTQYAGDGGASYTHGKINRENAYYYFQEPFGTANIEFTFDINGGTQKGALDYFIFHGIAKLSLTEKPLIFYSPNENGAFKYEIETAAENPLVFKVSDFRNIEVMETAEENDKLVFYAEETYGRASKYIAVNGTNFKTASFESVENQNVHGSNANAELIIIANRKFSEAAERFAEYKTNESPNRISAAVFYTDEIYNEFSCGAESDPIAIRDFIMYAYNNWDVLPRYVLLFGNGTYDYFDTEKAGNNYVPTFQSKDRSLYEVDSYMTDDFFGWVDGGDKIMDVGVGRFPVKSEEEAEAVVDKIIAYENNEDFSDWRRLAVLVADDGWTTSRDDGNEHTRYSEELADVIPDYFDKDKIYLVLYPTEITGAGRRKPAVNQAIIDAFNNGALIMNYQGHGNPDVWAHEQVFVKDATIPQLSNDNLVFVTAAACDFGRSDDPTRISGAELLLLKPDGGAIGSFASNRLVFSYSNSVLNEYFYSGLFLRRDENNLPPTLGDAFLYAKISYPIVNSYKYSLLGDPSLRLKVPVLQAAVDSVNGNSLENAVLIKALSDVKIDGSVNDNNLDGEAVVTVYDAKRYVTITEPGWHNMKVEFNGAILYKGRASVEAGKFGAQFVVPKDISYENQNGKIVVYLQNGEIDGVGFTNNILVNGIEERENDGTGPEIEVAFDDFNSNGNLVNRNFTFLLRLTDETGINTSGAGIGHTLEGIIDDDLENPIDFTDAFLGDIDAGGTSGEVRYNFYNFAPGEHTIKIKAWDVFNNPSEKETDFTVVEGDGLTVRNIVNYPNPFSGSTYFTFQHNLSEPIDVIINIYTVYGRKIKEIKEFGIADRFVKIYWDGRDEDYGELANGTYLYKLIINSQSGKYSESFLGKLSKIK